MKKNRVKGLLALGLSLTMMISTAGCGKEQQQCGDQPGHTSI